MSELSPEPETKRAGFDAQRPELTRPRLRGSGDRRERRLSDQLERAKEPR